MGYTSSHPCFLDLNMKQTPENIRKVLDIAGWNLLEAANETGIFKSCLADACSGTKMLHDEKWRLLLDKAGRRAFDHEDAE